MGSSILETAFNPELLSADFEWRDGVASTGIATPSRVLSQNPNRIALVFVSATGTTYGISPLRTNLATGGFRLTAANQRLEFFHRDYGAMVGSDWWCQTVGAANLWFLEIIYKPNRV